ncbi:hypothetical protein [Micromonospora sp. NPDC047740]|uniref:hypothetical protein n=1 Tax=Micromonospora sp. NPDC047740 TaxID=3364254 RepID=UPI003712B2BB
MSNYTARGTFGRRSLFKAAAAGAAGTAAFTTGTSSLAEAAAASARSKAGFGSLPTDLHAILDAWSEAPSSYHNLGDWRRVGYRRGAIQPSPVVDSVTPAQSLGIRPDTGVDVSSALQTALDRLGAAGGGVLKLEPGRYVLDRPLFVSDSNVVLRGAGKGKTILYFSRPLRESLDAGGNNWSWTGGQIFFIARERLAKSFANDFAAELSECFLWGSTLAAVAPATRGADVLFVDSTADLTAGEMVALEVDNPTNYRLLKEMAGNIAGANTYDWARYGARIATPTAFEDLQAWRWPVKVIEILSPRSVRIEQPLRISIHRETPARLRELGPTIHDSGVEGLTIENKLIPQTAHNLHPGSNGVCFQAVYDCWAKDVHVLNADVAFGLTGAKSCTMSGISAGGRSLHHFVACRILAHDNLIEDFHLEDFTVPAVRGSVLHGLNLEGLSSGNVYRRGLMETGLFDTHRQLPFENLRTDITVTNKDAGVGGAGDAGPYFGCRIVHWGIRVTNDKNLGMEVSDVAPASLTAGITGLTSPGSGGLDKPSAHGSFTGDIESESLDFGTDLGQGSDLLDLQRAIAAV